MKEKQPLARDPIKDRMKMRLENEIRDLHKRQKLRKFGNINDKTIKDWFENMIFINVFQDMRSQ